MKTGTYEHEHTFIFIEIKEKYGRIGHFFVKWKQITFYETLFYKITN